MALPIITSIDPLPSDPNVLRIRVDGTIAARLPRSDVQSLNLETGQTWDDAIEAQVQRLIALNKTRKAAMSLLGRRGFSRAELLERLERKGHEQSLAREVADQLQRDGWIDDAAYAESIVHELLRTKPAARTLVLEKLHARGIEDETARQVADRMLGETSQVDAAASLARERLEAMQSLPQQTAVRRVAGLLARRGFDEATIQDAIEQTGLVEYRGD